jgi:hypothetical protein
MSKPSSSRTGLILAPKRNTRVAQPQQQNPKDNDLGARMVAQALMAREPEAIRGYLAAIANWGESPETAYETALTMLPEASRNLAPPYAQMAPAQSRPAETSVQ